MKKHISKFKEFITESDEYKHPRDPNLRRGDKVITDTEFDHLLNWLQENIDPNARLTGNIIFFSIEDSEAALNETHTLFKLSQIGVLAYAGEYGMEKYRSSIHSLYALKRALDRFESDRSEYFN